MAVVSKSGIVENVLTWADFKQSKELKKNDGTKRQRVSGIAKLDDANDAGGRNSESCTLILTEGDSAKALAVSLGITDGKSEDVAYHFFSVTTFLCRWQASVSWGETPTVCSHSEGSFSMCAMQLISRLWKTQRSTTLNASLDYSMGKTMKVQELCATDI